MKPGDVVKLKSGGPNMTVEETPSVDGVERVNCVWFEEHSGSSAIDGPDNGGIWELKRAGFLSAVLRDVG